MACSGRALACLSCKACRWRRFVRAADAQRWAALEPFMWIVNFPVLHPFIFWLIAIAWSIYQSFCGYHYGLYIFNSHRKDELNMVWVRRWF
jgi:hypothetical protein